MGEFMITLEEDKLQRQTLLNDLFKIFEHFGNQDGQGLTMLINGKYGTGKSTLLNFIEQKNEKENKFNVVYYDAWQSNYFDNPIIPLMYSLSKLKTTSKKFKDTIKKIVQSLPKIFTRSLANAHMLDLTDLTENDIFTEFDQYNKTLESYKQILTEYCKDKKTIFLVDELDRCLPEYQIKVLESIYHMLNIPNIIVVIALDKNQLDTAIKSKFGVYTDTYGYLSKFIQYEIDLPENSTYEYTSALMTFHVEDESYIKHIISNMFQSISLPLRDCKLIIQKLNIICKEEKDGWGHPKSYYYYYPTSLAFLLLLKHTQQKIYKKYFGKTIERDYNSQKTSFAKTRYSRFLSDIKETEFNSIIEYLLSQDYGQAIMLSIINLFDSTSNITEQELANYVHRSLEDVQQITSKSRFANWYFPKSRNGIIKTIEIIV